MKHKKALATFEIIVIAFAITSLLTSFMVYLFIASEIPSESKLKKQQLLFTTLTSQECFFDENRYISDDIFTQETLDNCTSSYEFDSLAKISIITEDGEIVRGPLYLGEQNEFERNNQFCSISASQLCSGEIRLPLVSKQNREYIALEMITGE